MTVGGQRRDGPIVAATNLEETLVALAEALLVDEDLDAARRIFDTAANDTIDQHPWAEWARLASLLAQERVSDAMAIHRLLPKPEPVVMWTQGIDGWRQVGDGSIDLSGDAARLVA